MVPRATPWVLGVLLLAVILGPAVGVAPSADRGAAAGALQTTPDEFENTLFRMTVYENGSARWTVQHARPLNESDREAFEAFAQEFNSRETSTYSAFKNRTRQLLAFGRDTTDRDMRATAFSRRAYVNELGQTRGVLEMSFIWTAFGRSDGDRVRVGDVFEGGMYIATGQRLAFARGPTLEFQDVQPPPDSMTEEGSLAASESVTWRGERQFADQRPAAELVARTGNGSGGDTRDGGTDGGATDGGGESGDDDGTATGGDGLPILLGGILLMLLLLGALAWYTDRLPSRDGQTTHEQSASPANASDGGGGAATAGAGVSEADLLSDEDRVVKLLSENGGRMKQVDIVDETDWSKSKVSMLLTDMDEAGKISKLRLGRENIISLAGQEPDAAGSPFEEDQ